MNRSVTIDNVARAAGVSRATAARALGGYGVTSAVARGKVLAAAEALGYRPNELARSMTTGRSGIIGVVVGDIENPFFSLAVRGIGDVARQGGFNVIVANSGERSDAEKEAVRVLLGRRVDGLIITPSQSRDVGHIEEALRRGLPLALLDRTIPGLEVDAATTDDRAASIAVTRLLLKRGHVRIAYVSAAESRSPVFADPAEIATASVRARVAALIETSRAAGIREPERFIRLDARSGNVVRQVTRELMTGGEPPSAIIASDSVIGLQVFRVLRELRLAIPKQVSFVTFHNADWTEVTSPPVAVVDQPVYELGRLAADLVLRRIDDRGAPPWQQVLSTTILPRGSIGPAVNR